jgi:uncharacterized protein (TIGR02757 family)
MTSPENLRDLLESNFSRYYKKDFVEDDPLSIPHQFSRLQDIEIAGFFTATIAWGNRKSIIKSAQKLMDLMDSAPFEFITQHSDKDLKRFESFVHRTFQPTDLLYFIHRLKAHYSKHSSLETMFSEGYESNNKHVGPALARFHDEFFNDHHAPLRTRKHVATPLRKSACKRLNMYLRWMVRPDDIGVDFGLWKNINTSQLLLPLDVHVQRVALKLGLLQRKQSDWKACLELWGNIRKYDLKDPAKYDFVLFGMGVNQFELENLS